MAKDTMNKRLKQENTILAITNDLQKERTNKKARTMPSHNLFSKGKN